MGLDRAKFFSEVRRTLFGGRLNAGQVLGLDTILNTWDNNFGGDLRHLAYMMATAYHEVGKTMLPVREGFKITDAAARKVVAKRRYGKPDPKTGHVYYGRGLVQLTWAENYKKMGALLGIPLYTDPDLALQPAVSVAVLYEGMLTHKSFKGDFTGRSLEDYFNAKKEDWINARRIINGTDKAAVIAGHGRKFYAALQAAARGA